MANLIYENTIQIFAESIQSAENHQDGSIVKHTVAIHQPHFFPWLGYFNKFALADSFVLLDDVQFRRGYFQNRTRLENQNGSYWFTLPVKARRHNKVQEVHTIDFFWRERLLNQIRFNYGKAPYFEETYSFLTNTLEGCETTSISKINHHTISKVCDHLQLNIAIHQSSNMNISGNPDTRLLRICSKIGANQYLFGEGGGKEYHGTGMFAWAAPSISIRSQNFRKPFEKSEFRDVSQSFNTSVLHFLCYLGANTVSEIVSI